MTERPTITRLSSQVDFWISEILENSDIGEDIVYDAAIQSMPDPSRDYAFAPQLVIYLEIAGAVPDTQVFGTPIVLPYGLKYETVQSFVLDAITSLKAERERQAQMLGLGLPVPAPSEILPTVPPVQESPPNAFGTLTAEGHATFAGESG